MRALHGLHSFEAFVNGSMQSLRSAPATSPQSANFINMLTSVPWVLTSGKEVIHSFRQLWVVKSLTRILGEVEDVDFDDPVRAGSIRFLYNVAVHEPAQIQATNDPDRIKFVPALQSQLNRVAGLLAKSTLVPVSNSPQK